MHFGLSVEQVQSRLQRQEPYAYEAMEEFDTSNRPITNDELSQGTFGPRAPKAYAVTQQQLTDVMDIEDVPQKERLDTTVTSSPMPREHAGFLHLLGFVRDKLLATVGMGPKTLEALVEKADLLDDSTGINCGLDDNDTSKLQELSRAQRPVCNATPKSRGVVNSFHQLSLTEPVNSWFVPHPASSGHDSQANVAPSDPEPERGRSRMRQTVAERERSRRVKCPPRRLTSPDWNAALGDADPSFVPDSTYHCSRCLRQMPEADRRPSAKQMSDYGEEYKFHISGDRCCRIRNGIGSVKNLPNRSGWIPASDLPELSIIKCEFLKTHPEYAATLYPILPSDVRNLWRSDPNNESNRANWHLPWPPHDMGAAAALRPIPEEAGGSEESTRRGASGGRTVTRSSVAASAKKTGSVSRNWRKRDADEDAYSDGTNTTDADDELSSPDKGWILHKKKRRRLGDATYRPRRHEDPDSDDEEMLVGGAPERLRKEQHEMEQEINSMRENGEVGW